MAIYSSSRKGEEKASLLSKIISMNSPNDGAHSSIIRKENARAAKVLIHLQMELNGTEMMQSSFYTTEIHNDDWHDIQTYSSYLRPAKCQYIPLGKRETSRATNTVKLCLNNDMKFDGQKSELIMDVASLRAPHTESIEPNDEI